MANVRAFEEGDYPEIARWFSLRSWPELPLEMLPQNGAFVEGKAAGFLYLTDSPIGWLEWVVSNPEAPHDGAVESVLEYLVNKAEELGCQVLLCTIQHKGLIEKYKNSGFLVTDTSMTNMMRRV